MSIKIGKYKTMSGYDVEIVCRLPEPNGTQYKWFGYYYNTKMQSYFVENWDDNGNTSRNDERFNIIVPKIYKYKNVYTDGGFSHWWGNIETCDSNRDKYGTLRIECDSQGGLILSTIEFAREGEIPESWKGDC